MERLRVNKDDIEDFLVREKAAAAAAAAAKQPNIPSSPVSSEENFAGPGLSKPFEGQPSRIDTDDLPVNPSHPEAGPPPSKDNSMRAAGKRSDNDVTVMNTLRLLSAIEHLLDDLGFRIIQVILSSFHSNY